MARAASIGRLGGAIAQALDELKPALDDCFSAASQVRNAGPPGAPGLPEWGQLPIPKKLLEQGVRDMVRISDARMSGTSYGACVLHISCLLYTSTSPRDS